MSILFIVRGKVGGCVETCEFEDNSNGHFYMVQENAWMDATSWCFYVEKLLMYGIDGPAVSFSTTLSVTCMKKDSGS